MNFTEVKLYSSDLQLMKEFYVDLLGFNLVKLNTNQLTIKVGESNLSFLLNSTNKEYIYHYAFTIPENLFNHAKKMFKSKVSLNTEENDDEVYFKFLDAKSFYFNDPSNNVIELIARNSYQSDKNNFSINDIISISEINFTVDKVIQEASKLFEHGFKLIDGRSLKEDGLNFIGDNYGYLLVGPPKRNWFFSNQISKVSPVSVELKQGLIIELNENGKISIEVKGRHFEN